MNPNYILYSIFILIALDIYLILKLNANTRSRIRDIESDMHDHNHDINKLKKELRTLNGNIKDNKLRINSGTSARTTLGGRITYVRKINNTILEKLDQYEAIVDKLDKHSCEHTKKALEKEYVKRYSELLREHHDMKRLILNEYKDIKSESGRRNKDISK